MGNCKISKWQEFYNKWIIRILIKEPLKHGSYLLSHGFVHFIVGVGVCALTIILAQANINSSEESLHQIYIDMNHEESKDSIKLSMFNIDFIIDDDSLLNANEKYRSMIDIHFRYNTNADNSKDTKGVKYNSTTSFSISSNPLSLSDIKVTDENDNIIEPLSEDSGETKKIECIPTAEIPRLIGGYRAGPKGIKLYSNFLGLNENNENKSWKLLNFLGLNSTDPCYNYFIGFENNFETDSMNWQMISFRFGVKKWQNKRYIPTKKIKYQIVHPTPDILNNGYICYNTKESIKKVKDNKGIIIQAIDIDAQNRNSKKAIIASILVGTGAALLFDILIQLVRELRNVNRKKEEEEKLANKENKAEETSNIEAEVPKDEKGTNESNDRASSLDCKGDR